MRALEGLGIMLVLLGVLCGPPFIAVTIFKYNQKYDAAHKEDRQ